MKKITQKKPRFFKYFILCLTFFFAPNLEGQTCAGLDRIYQTRGVPSGIDGVVQVFQYDPVIGDFNMITTLTVGLDQASGAASAYNSNTGLLYIHGKDDTSGNTMIRVFNPANDFNYVGKITLTSIGGLSMYANMWSVGNHIYFREDGGNYGRFNVAGLVYNSNTSSSVTILAVTGANAGAYHANDYASYSGVYYGLYRPTATTTTCRLVMINATNHAVSGRTLTLTNPGTGRNFDNSDFGAVWVDRNGYLVAFNNAGRVYISNGPINDSATNLTYILSAGSSSNNDGFSCDQIDFFEPQIVVTAPGCNVAGTATISNYYNESNIDYIFYNTGGTVVNGVTINSSGKIISGLSYGQQYTVALHLADANFTSEQSVPFTFFNALTPVTAAITPASASTNCTTPSVTFTATGGASYSWSPATGLSNANIANPVATPSATTTYAVTVTGANGCTGTASATVTVNSTPIVPTISTTSPTCSSAGNSTISNYNASNTYTFVPTGPAIAVTGLIFGMVTGTSYTVTVAANTICASATSASFSNSAISSTPSVPTISSTSATCSAAGSSTVSNYIASNTYAFTPSGPTVDGTGLISGMATGTSYTVTANNGNCTSASSASFSNSAILATPSVPTISGTAATCSASGTSTISNYNAANTYAFTPSGPTAGGTGLISGMVTGTYYTVTTSNATCTSASSASFSNSTILSTPSVLTISSTAATCSAAGTSTISNYNAANTYAFTPSGPTAGGTGLISGMVAGTSYTVKASNAACTSASSASFSNSAILPTPAVPDISTAHPTCSSASASTVTNYNASNTYNFIPSGPTVNASGLISGMVIGIQYTVKATNGSCTSEASDAISVSGNTQNSWTGSVSNAWNATGNWSCEQVPTLFLDAYIPMVDSGNYPIIDGNDGIANCKNLIIDSNASILISGNDAGILRIAGTVTNNGIINAVNGTLSMNGTTHQLIPDTFTNHTLYGITIDNPAGANLEGLTDLTGVLKIENGTFYTNNKLTLKSNAATTAMIAPVAGAVSGTMVIERYIPARRAFRLISSPVNGGSITENWQENFGTAEGFGTDITGNGGTADGFDLSGSNNPSLFTFDNIAGTWNAVQSTNQINLSAGLPYRMLIRGDRNINQFSNWAVPTNTTIRSTGTIVTGPVQVSGLSTVAGKWNFIGNPYQAPVNMASVVENSSNINPNFYYGWDPTLGGSPIVGQAGGRGAYVTVMLPQGTNTSGSEANKYLQPNQGVFLQTLTEGAATSVTFSEPDKDLITSITPSLYRKGSDNVVSISLMLYDSNSLSLNDTPADGLIVQFSDDYSSTIDSMDATKMINQDENVAFSKTGKLLSVERRSMPAITDILQLFNSQYRKTDYTYTIETFGLEYVTAYLIDNYAGTSTQLANNDLTLYNFHVNPEDSASIESNRFKIVFAESALSDGSIAKGKPVKIYPNPLKEGEELFINVQNANTNTEVVIYSPFGQRVISSVNVQSNTKLKIIPRSSMAAGLYMVYIIQDQKTTSKKLIIL